ncbi:myb-related transcription factor, partner of profilin-like [Thalassophryne amazonica]|uniref:myb-related transcription factor, partner of profilin-like n=1 Tax=Thalassophryne amazonica TaxID=390379 RepID=UPI001470AD03|nr:myb-related transcription factor, partner of profilin-like [Thalassophryne amazonica]
MADLVGYRRQRFSGEETDLLVREVKAREQLIYGTSNQPPNVHEVKQAWEEVAAKVSTASGISRTATQCRKRYNDVRRRGKQKLSAHQKQQLAMRGGGASPKTEELSSPEDLADSALCADIMEGFGGLEVGVQEKTEEDIKPSLRELGPIEEEEKVEETPRGDTSCPKPRRNIIRAEDHPFLEIQQAGFRMLERELGGLRRSVCHLNARLSRIEMMLRPLGQLAEAVERLVPAASSSSSPPPPPSTRMSPYPIRRRQNPAAPGSSRGQRKPHSLQILYF